MLRVRLEEHVLVHVRQPFRARALGEGTVSDIEFDRRQRNAVILRNDDFQSVREHAMADELFELGALRAQANGRKGGRTHGEGNHDPGKPDRVAVMCELLSRHAGNIRGSLVFFERRWQNIATIWPNSEHWPRGASRPRDCGETSRWLRTPRSGSVVRQTCCTMPPRQTISQTPWRRAGIPDCRISRS